MDYNSKTTGYAVPSQAQNASYNEGFSSSSQSIAVAGSQSSSPDGAFTHACSGLKRAIEEQEKLLDILVQRVQGYLRPAIPAGETVQKAIHEEVSPAVELVNSYHAHVCRNIDKINYMLNHLES